jgi:hypothetical protein
MRTWHVILIFIVSSTLSCDPFENTKPTTSAFFIKQYVGPYDYQAVDVQQNNNHYFIAGNMTIREDSVVSFIIKVDGRGDLVQPIQYYPGCTAKSFYIPKSGITGMLLLGDSIKLNPAAADVADIEVRSIKLYHLNDAGEVIKTKTLKDTRNVSKQFIDFKGNALTQNEAGDIIILGNLHKDLTTPEETFLTALNTDLSEKWNQQYTLIDVDQADYNYSNNQRIYASQGDLIWATSLSKKSGDFREGYLGVSVVVEASTFKNFSTHKETPNQNLIASGITPDLYSGYAMIGTRTKTDGSLANVFFCKVDREGNIQPDSFKYYDGVLSSTGNNILMDDSQAQDEGLAISSTPDGGYILAGSTKNGIQSRKLLLIKVDGDGNISWLKTMGGNGDYVVTHVMTDGDGNLIFVGTNTIEGLSSIFLIKTNSFGEIL